MKKGAVKKAAAKKAAVKEAAAKEPTAGKEEAKAPEGEGAARAPAGKEAAKAPAGEEAAKEPAAKEAAKDEPKAATGKADTAETNIHVHPRDISEKKKADGRHKLLSLNIETLIQARRQTRDARRDKTIKELKEKYGDKLKLPAVRKELRQLAWLEARLERIREVYLLADEKWLLKEVDKAARILATIKVKRLKAVTGGE